MAGVERVLDTASAIVADRDVEIEGDGAHAAATFLVNVTGITRTTGTLEIFLRRTAGGSNINIAFLTGIIATGLVRIPLAAGFSATREGIPEPNQILWNLVGDATAVSGELVAIYGD